MELPGLEVLDSNGDASSIVSEAEGNPFNMDRGSKLDVIG